MWHGLDTKLAAWNRREGRIHTWTMEEGGERGREHLGNRGRRKRGGRWSYTPGQQRGSRTCRSVCTPLPCSGNTCHRGAGRCPPTGATRTNYYN